VDGNENAFITGWSNLLFPDTPGAFAPCDGGGAFVTKLNDTGSDLIYSGCIAGFNAEGSDLALDPGGLAYVAGQSGSGLPTTTGAYQEAYGGGAWDAFLVVVSADGVTLDYVTYVGGDDSECVGTINGCTLDLDTSTNHVYLGGDTESPDFPTSPGAYDTVCGTDGNCDDSRDVFFVKLNPAGTGASDLLYGTYGTFLGANGLDSGGMIATGPAGEAYLTGATSSTSFPTTAGAFDTSFNGGFEDAFFTVINPAGGGNGDLVYSTFLGGGAPGDHGLAIDADGDGYAYVAGNTNSTGFPTTPDGYDTTLNGPDAFLLKLDPAGNGSSDLLYGTFLGGTAEEAGEGCALLVDGSGNAYLAGNTESNDFPTSTNPFDTSFNGGTHDAFVLRMPTLVEEYRVYLPIVLR
jgi:hypothetical protein